MPSQFPASLTFDELIALFCERMHVQAPAPGLVNVTIWDRRGDDCAQYASKDGGATFTLTTVYPTVHHITL